MDDFMGFEKLGLYFDTELAGFDGENFTYSVYLDDALTDEKSDEINRAVSAFLEAFDEDTYPGYVDVTNEDDKVMIYLDLGNTTPETENISIQGILKALGGVSGISRVVVNEDCGGFDF